MFPSIVQSDNILDYPFGPRAVVVFLFGPPSTYYCTTVCILELCRSGRLDVGIVTGSFLYCM